MPKSSYFKYFLKTPRLLFKSWKNCQYKIIYKNRYMIIRSMNSTQRKTKMSIHLISKLINHLMKPKEGVKNTLDMPNFSQ